MKFINKLLSILILALFFSLSGYGQGTVNFNTRVPGVVDAPVFHVDGVTLWAGDRFNAQLWAAPPGVSDPTASLQPLFPITTFGTGENAGYVVPVEAAVPGFPGGEQVLIQMRIWDRILGTTWETAPMGTTGESNLILVGPLGDPTASPPIPPANLVGLQGLQIPEPSAIALVLLGACALLGWRRCKS
jgi:hypothetical protein